MPHLSNSHSTHIPTHMHTYTSLPSSPKIHCLFEILTEFSLTFHSLIFFIKNTFVLLKLFVTFLVLLNPLTNIYIINIKTKQKYTNAHKWVCPYSICISYCH